MACLIFPVQWLAEQVLRDKWVLAAAGARQRRPRPCWRSGYAGLAPRFLIGVIPQGILACRPACPGAPRRENSVVFCHRADGIRRHFFDKRLIHYHPRTAILNNLEFRPRRYFSRSGCGQKPSFTIWCAPCRARADRRQWPGSRHGSRAATWMLDGGANSSAVTRGWQIGAQFDDGCEVLFDGRLQGRLR